MRLAVTFAAFTLLCVFAPTAQAQTPDHQITIQGLDVQGCLDPELELYCFVVTEGTFEGVAAGDSVEITFTNGGQAPHNLFVANARDADPSHDDTDAAVAIASTQTIGNGEEAIVSFVVPIDAVGLYLWCDVGDHESGGMYLEVDVVPMVVDEGSPEESPDDNATSPPLSGGDDENGVPFTFVLVPAALVVAVLVRRRS